MLARLKDKLERAVTWLLLKLLRAYQLLLSPWIGNQCRFYPTCSHYAVDALQTHGPWRGLYLTLTRLGRCHPWHAGGVDTVPAKSHQVTALSGTQPHAHD